MSAPFMDLNAMRKIGEALESAYRGATEPSPAAPPAPTPPTAPVFAVPGHKPNGLLTTGNIDIAHRPHVYNPETGGYSSVWSTSVEIDGKTYLLPRVSDDGKILSVQQAVDNFKKTGRHLGQFDSWQDADAYAQALHVQQETQGAAPSPWGTVSPQSQKPATRATPGVKK